MIWKVYSRHCVRCGEVGPRVSNPRGAGFIHSRCLTDDEKRRVRFEAYFQRTAHQQLMAIACEEGIS